MTSKSHYILVIMGFLVYFSFFYFTSHGEDHRYVYEILHKNQNNLLIINSIRAIIDSSFKNKNLFLYYYNQKIYYNLRVNNNKLILKFKTPMVINTIKIKSFIFNLSSINKITEKKYHLPMYLESIEYILQQKGNFNYYGEVLNILQNIIPQVTKNISDN
jgi:hypothetical protein